MNDIRHLFPRSAKLLMIWVVFLIFVSAIFEAIVILLIPDIIQNLIFGSESDILTKISQLFGIGYENLTLFASAFYITTSIISILSIYSVYRYGHYLGAFINGTLFKRLITGHFLYFLEKPMSEVTNELLIESNRISNQIIIPALLLVHRSTLAVAIVVSLLIHDFLTTLIATSAVIITYLTIIRLLKNSIINAGRDITDLNEKRVKLIQLSFLHIKEVILKARQPFLLYDYSKHTKEYAKTLAFLQFAAISPKYILEAISILTVILFLLIANNNGNINVEAFIGTMGAFALAGLKLLPASQQIYSSLSSLRGNLNAFRNTTELIRAKSISEVRDVSSVESYSTIDASNVVLKYPSGKKVGPYNFRAQKGSLTVINGPSGSGKSSLLYLISGLCSPQEGEIKLDGISQNGLYYHTLSILFQEFYLDEEFGKNNLNEIDKEKLYQYITLLNLKSLVDVETFGEFNVIENGKLLSGGQRQRLGILQAVSQCKNTLILDEPTSSLDKENALTVCKLLHELKERYIVIVISHDPVLIDTADTLFSLEG